MASKWHKQLCPMCREGTLHDGVKLVEQTHGSPFLHRVFGRRDHRIDSGEFGQRTRLT